MDDQRRIKIQWERLRELVPGCVAVGTEVYTVGSGGANASGWKTALSYQASCAVAWEYGVELHVQLPADLRRGLLGTAKGGKVSVMSKLLTEISGLDKLLEEHPPGAWEHLVDAAGHALLALRKHVEIHNL